MSSGDRRLQRSGNGQDQAMLHVMVEVVWVPTQVVSELPPRWEILFERHRLSTVWLQGRGSRLFRGAMWKSDGFRWIWEEGIAGLHVGKEEKGRDGCNGGAGW